MSEPTRGVPSIRPHHPPTDRARAMAQRLLDEGVRTPAVERAALDPTATYVMPQRVLAPPPARPPLTRNDRIAAMANGALVTLFVICLILAVFLAGMIYQASLTGTVVGG